MKPKNPMVLQMLMGHCWRKEREEEDEQGWIGKETKRSKSSIEVRSG